MSFSRRTKRWKRRWISSTTIGDWEFFLGLLRAAVANHKLTQGAASGAIAHLQAALRYLAPYPDRYQGLKLRELRYALSAQLNRLMSDGEPPRAPHIELT